MMISAVVVAIGLVASALPPARKDEAASSDTKVVVLNFINVSRDG